MELLNKDYLNCLHWIFWVQYGYCLIIGSFPFQILSIYLFYGSDFYLFDLTVYTLSYYLKFWTKLSQLWALGQGCIWPGQDNNYIDFQHLQYRNIPSLDGLHGCIVHCNTCQSSKCTTHNYSKYSDSYIISYDIKF